MGILFIFTWRLDEHRDRRAIDDEACPRQCIEWAGTGTCPYIGCPAAGAFIAMDGQGNDAAGGTAMEN